MGDGGDLKSAALGVIHEDEPAADAVAIVEEVNILNGDVVDVGEGQRLVERVAAGGAAGADGDIRAGTRHC